MTLWKDSFIDKWFFEFFRYLKLFVRHVTKTYVAKVLNSMEGVKSLAVVKMYAKRGRYAALFMHAGVVGTMALGVAVGPSLLVDSGQARTILSSAVGNKAVIATNGDGEVLGVGGVVSADQIPTMTMISDKPRAEDIEYIVQDGDTVSTIAEKFGVSVDTLKWANPNMTSIKTVKPGQKLIVPPVTGVVHIVKSGETIYSIAKKYSVDAQAVVDYPFNSFTNDETFSLAIGQRLIVPDGVMPAQAAPAVNSIARTPDAGAVTATGSWAWPTKGVITQGFKPWHKAIDVANPAAPPILAADSGTVMVAGWPDNSGYGNRVVINHGNGFITLYGHMSRIDVKPGQTVKRGDQLGIMGSTGRSTGTHLHFEIRTSKGNIDPLKALR